MDVRGLTLRSKSSRRPQISAPKPISDPNASKTRAGGPPGPSPARQPPHSRQPQNGTTSDLVKRRYSTRFNQPPNFSGADAPPVPGLPSGPGAFTAGRGPPSGSEPLPGVSQPLRVDKNALSDPNLPVDKYVTSLLANASEDDIREYQANLQKLKNRTSADLQQNVYKNRTQFIKISKEAERLKGEMSTLRGLMSELTSALGQANATNEPISLGFDDSAVAKRNKRSSVANLESMWNIQLQALWKNVERSQKFLPAVPGRHIVLETPHWVELDSATWKPRRPVHLVLLNDHLLIAAKKRKRMDPNIQNKGPVPTKLVAEECWPLQDIDLIDLGANLAANGVPEDMEQQGIPNAINIRYGQRSFTYRHDQRNGSAKTDLILTFRKAVEDLRKTLRSETEAAAKALETSNHKRSHSRKSEVFDTMTSPRDKLDILIDVDGKQQNMRWMEGQLDELDISIALQHFENAVSSVERLRKLVKGMKGNVAAQDAITFKIDDRASKLAETLIRVLADKHSFLMATKTHVSWLTRLGFDDRAREAYLHARSDIITKRARQCVFEGDLPLYIFQISFVYFTILKNTISIYQQCFPAPMSSACIKWAKAHLDGFNDVLARQLSSVEPDSQVWQKCIDIAHEHAGMLADVGVDFTGMVGRGFARNGNGTGHLNGNGATRSKGAEFA